MADKALSQITPDELRAENPNLVTLILANAKTEHETVLAEMKEKVEQGVKDADVLTKVKEALGIAADADPLAAIAVLAQRVGAEAKAVYDKLLDKEIAKRIPGEDDDEVVQAQRKLVRRLAFQTEMVDKLKDAKDEAAALVLVGEQVEGVFNEDEQVKLLIGEQTPVSIRRREELRTDGKKDMGGYVSEETVRMS